MTFAPPDSIFFQQLGKLPVAERIVELIDVRLVQQHEHDAWIGRLRLRIPLDEVIVKPQLRFLKPTHAPQASAEQKDGEADQERDARGAEDSREIHPRHVRANCQ